MQKIKRLIVSGIVLSLTVLSCKSYDFSEADKVIEESIAAGTIPGAVLSVVKGNKVIYHKAYGNKSVTPDVVPMTEDVVFDLASVTKPVGTAMSVMKLYEDGLLDLDAPVGRYLPQFDPGEDITLVDMLTHTSGLPNYHGYISTAGYAGRPDSLLCYVGHGLPRLEKTYRYSCLNFFVLAKVVETVSGERICDYATEHFYRPLGMDDTRYHILGEPIAPDYYARISPQNSGKLLRVGDAQDALARVVCEGNGGNAGLFSTASDLSVFARCMLHGGCWKGVRILEESTVRKMRTVAKSGRTLGWDCSSTASFMKGDRLGDDLICHSGYSGTFILIDYGHDLAIVLLANRTHPRDTGYEAFKHDRAKVCNAIADAMKIGF